MAISVKTSKGDIRISNSVLIKIITNIARECYGVIGFTAGKSAKILNSDNVPGLSKGVKIKSEQGKIAIDIHIATTYGINMQSVSEGIRSSVKYQIEEFTGVEVGSLNVHVETIRDLD